MKKIHFMAVVAALCVASVFTGCQEKIAGEAVQSKVTLEVRVPVAETKVVSGMNETAISNYQVFLFNDKGVLEAYENTDAPDISMDCTMGEKTVAVLVNAPAISDVTTLDALQEKTSALSDNRADAFVMEGKVPVSIVTTENVSVTVPVTRQVAKVELAAVSTSFELPQYRDMSFKICAVYLINVSADKKYFSNAAPTQWLHKMKYVDTDFNLLTYDDMEDFDVSASSPYTTRNLLYCYPNPTSGDSFESSWTARHTRLVVETELGGTKYYYPVTLPVVEQNKHYQVNLTITRPGSYSPDVVVDKFAADFAVTVKDWETGASVSEEI